MFVPKEAQAASLSVSANSRNVTVGGSVTIYVKASDLAGKFSISTSNGSILSGGNGGIWIENGTQSFKFQAKKAGTATITVTPIDAAGLSTNNKYTEKKSISITVSNPREKSSNNNLKELKIDGYELSPNFDKNTLEYKVDLPSNIEKIKINATKENNYATVEGAGEISVNEGENKIEVKVTSETGKSKVYTIIATVKDEHPIEIKIDSDQYTVVKRAGLLEKPEQFEEKSVQIGEFEIPAFYHEKANLTLVGLKDKEGMIGLFIYDEKTNTYQAYQSITATEITFFELTPPKPLEGYHRQQITIGDKKFTGYTYQKNSDFILLYGKNIATAEEGWYSYHIKEKTLQKYNDTEITQLKKEFDKEKETDKIFILSLGGFSILLLVIILILILKKSRKKEKNSTEKKTTSEPIVKQIPEEKKEEPNKKTKIKKDKKAKKKDKYDFDDFE